LTSRKRRGGFWDNYDTEPNGKAHARVQNGITGETNPRKPKNKSVEKGTYCTEKVIVLIYSIRVLVD